MCRERSFVRVFVTINKYKKLVQNYTYKVQSLVFELLKVSWHLLKNTVIYDLIFGFTVIIPRRLIFTFRILVLHYAAELHRI